LSNIIDIIIRADIEGEGNLKDLNKGLGNMDLSMKGLTTSLAKATASLGAFYLSLQGIKRGFTESVKLFTSFDDTMRAVQAVSGATGQEFQKLTDLAKQMGEETRFTATESAEALKILAQAGLEASESMEALPQVLALSASSGAGLAESTSILTRIMAGYGLTANELGHVNDVLVKTFTSTNTTINDLGETFKYVGPLGKALGIDIEELSATIGILGNAGIVGSKAGTDLKAILVALSAPTKKAGKLFKKLGVDTQEMGIDLADSASALESLGVTVLDNQGKMKPFVDILEEVSIGLAKIPEEGKRSGIAMEIFGKRAGPAMLALVEQGSGAIAKLRKEIDEAGGIGIKTAEIMESGLGGSFRRLKSVVESLGINFASEFAPALQELTEIAIEFLATFRDTALIQLGGLVSDVFTLGGALSEAESTAWSINESFKAIASVIGLVRIGLQTIALGFKEGIITVLDGIVTAFQAIAEEASKIPFLGDNITRSLKESADQLQLMSYNLEQQVIENFYEYADSVTKIKNDLAKMFEETNKGGKESAETYKEIKNQVDELGKKLIDGKITQKEYNDTVKIYEQEAKKAFKAGSTELKKITKLLQVSKEETTKTAQETDVYQKSMKELGISVDEVSQGLTETGQASVDAFNILAEGSAKVASRMKGTSEQVARFLEDVEKKGLLAGDALVHAFEEGIDTAKTVGDIEALVSALKDAREAGEITTVGLADGMELARDKASELASQAITTSSDIGSLANIMKAIKESSFDFGNELEQSLIPELSKLSTMDLTKLQNQLDTLFDQGIADASTFDNVTDAIASTLSEKLGVSARDFETNITRAVSTSVADLELLSETGKASGEVLQEAFQNIIDKAETEEDFNHLTEKLQEFQEQGVLSAEQVKEAMGGISEAVGDISPNVDAISEGMDQATVSAGEFTEGMIQSQEQADAYIEKQNEAFQDLNAGFDAGTVSADQLTEGTDKITENIKQAEEAAFDLGDAVEDAGDTLSAPVLVPWPRDIGRAVDEIGVDLKRLQDVIFTDHLDEISKYGSEYAFNINKLYDKMRQIIGNTADQIDEVRLQMQYMSESGNVDIDTINRMIDEIEVLDDATLDELRGEVADLEDQIDSARETAEGFVEDFTRELLQLEGDALELEKHEYETRKAELEELLEGAVDEATRRELQQALKLLEELHRKKLEDIEAEEEARRESAERSAEYEENLLDREEGDIELTDTGDIREVTNVVNQDINVTINAPHSVHEDYVREDVVPILQEIGFEATGGNNQ